MSDQRSESASNPQSPGDIGLGLTQVTRNPSEVIQRILQGQSLRTISKDYGISHVALRAWLLREDSAAYQEAVTVALTTRVAESDEALEVADDAVNIARAREMARFSRMDLERRRPQLYGQRTHVTHEDVSDLGERLRRARERTIDGTTGRVTPVDITPVMHTVTASSGTDTGQDNGDE